MEFRVSIAPEPVTDAARTVSIDLPADSVEDAAGNGNVAADDAFEVIFGNVPPQATLTSLSGDDVASSPIEVRLEIAEIFGEPVIAFELGDLDTVNVESISLVGDNNPQFLLEIMPVDFGTVELFLTQGAVTDVAGNENPPSNVLSVTFRAVPQGRPVPALSPVALLVLVLLIAGMAFVRRHTRNSA